LGDFGPIGLSAIRWPIGSTQPIEEEKGADKAPERAASGYIRPIGLSSIRWPIGSTQPIEEEKGAKFLRRNN